MTQTAVRHITLTELTALAETYFKYQQAYDELVARAAKGKEKLDFITQVLLPNAMREIGLTEFRLADGRRMVSAPIISASVTEDTMPMAESWLAEHKLDGIIKHQVICEFGKGENEQAKKIVEMLREAGIIDVQDKKSIHYQTLCATIREQMRAGVDFPEEPFHLFITDQVKVSKK